MNNQTLTRKCILDALVEALRALDYTHAMWEGGAAAFDRIDEWSDLDLQIIVDDDRVEDTFEVIECVLVELSPIELRYEIPQPTWHGYAQVFYRLQETTEFLIIDMVVIKRSNPNLFLEVERHGNVYVHFDKSEVIQPPPFDWGAHKVKLENRFADMQVLFDLFQMLTTKELNRGNAVEALVFYHSYTLRPLVEALRMRYKPAQHDFHTRYVHYDLPRDVVQKLQDLFYVTDMDDLRDKHMTAEEWFNTTVDEIYREGWLTHEL
jgi:hypothetical protein